MKIKDIGRTVTGKTPSTKQKDNYGGGILFITPEEVSNGYYVQKTERTLSDKGFESIKNNTLNGISVLVNCIGNIGDVAIVNGKCATNQQINAITDFKNGINPSYIYYKLQQYKQVFNNLAGNTVLKILPKSIFDEVDIDIPDLKRQNAISGILSCIDEIIYNNNSINAELDAMIKLIYDYWFLQFEFPNEDGKPYKSSGGKLVWNEELKKEIPEGWSIRKIQDYCNIFTGKKDVKQALELGKYKFYSCSPEHKFSDEKLYEGKAVLISGNGSYTGRTIFVNDAFDLYQRTYACTNKYKKDYMEYIYYSMLKFFVPKVSGGTHGSAIPYIVYDDIAKQQILINEQVVDKFIQKIKCSTDRIIGIKKENEELIKLRDFLLPLLMNGQVGFKKM